MAAAQNNRALVAGVAAQITESDCTKIRVQLLGTANVRLMAAPNATTPSSFDGGVWLTATGDLIPGSLALADLFPGVTSPVRLFALSDANTTVSFSHD